MHLFQRRRPLLSVIARQPLSDGRLLSGRRSRRHASPRRCAAAGETIGAEHRRHGTAAAPRHAAAGAIAAADCTMHRGPGAGQPVARGALVSSRVRRACCGGRQAGVHVG